MTDKQTVWVVVISTKHGVDAEVYATEDLAKDGLLDFVKFWWDEIESPDPMPADRDEAIWLYFDEHDNEWADISECVVHA